MRLSSKQENLRARSDAEWAEINFGDKNTRVTRMSEIEPLPVEWFWPRRIPLGMITVKDGDPGLGKSTVMLDLAARLSRGATMPDGSPGPEAAGTVILSAEDDAARVIRPRLDAAGADLERIATVQVVIEGGALRDPTICADDLRHVERAIGEVGAKLVIVDPLMAYLPADVNAHRDQDVRRALAELRALAERTGAAVVIIRHLNKTESANALYRGGGSIGIIGAARAGLMLAADPDDPSGEGRVLAMTKCNLAPMPPAMKLRLLGTDAGHPRVRWEGTSVHTAASLLETAADPEAHGELDRAKDFLRELLADGPVHAKEGKAGADEEGIRPRTLKRARQALRVVAYREAVPGPWLWKLPPPGPHGRVGPLGPVETAPPLAPAMTTTLPNAAKGANNTAKTAARGPLETTPDYVNGDIEVKVVAETKGAKGANGAEDATPGTPMTREQVAATMASGWEPAPEMENEVGHS